MLEVSELYIYPIKSLGGINVRSARVTDRGFQFDRRWMLVDENNHFLSQREHPQMSLLHVEIVENTLVVQQKVHHESLNIPMFSRSNQLVTVQVWSDKCKAEIVDPLFDAWFSQMLSIKCRLVYMPDASKRRVDTRYASNKEITSLSDGYPFLAIGQSSLDDLNSRLPVSLPMTRFRPNIVFTGAEAFYEDQMKHFTINNIDFYGVKLCARCVITTIDQDTAIKSREPLKTLSTYRQKNNKIYFGQNLLHSGEGEIKVGDIITVRQAKK